MNKNIKLIISHPGKTHRDDFLAIGLVQSICGREIPIQRRNPTPEELNDPDIAVVDCGERHDPALSCYDHHQFSRGTNECALSLTAKAYGQETALSRFEWYATTTMLDSNGPLSVARELGLEKFPNGLNSPIENSILRLTQKSLELESTLSKQIMDDILHEAWEIEKGITWLRKNARFEEVKGVPVIWAAVKDLNELARDKFRDEIAPGYKTPIAVQISYDNRNHGMSFHRFDDDPRVDFSKIEDNPEILFAHKNGFIAKTRQRLSLEECIELVEKSIR